MPLLERHEIVCVSGFDDGKGDGGGGEAEMTDSTGAPGSIGTSAGEHPSKAAKDARADKAIGFVRFSQAFFDDVGKPTRPW
jgi:hypothetical protein